MKKNFSKIKQRVAVFDIDGTIFRSSLLIEITDALIAEGVFPKKVRAVYAKAEKNWINRQDSYEKYIMAVVKAFESNIKGINHKDFTRIAKQVVAKRSLLLHTRFSEGLEEEGIFFTRHLLFSERFLTAIL